MSDKANGQCGPFRLHEVVGSGGMGRVYAARHVETGVRAAVKVLDSEESRGEDYRRALRSEVQALARLNHPGIASVYDYGTVGSSVAGEVERLVDGAPWIAMEFVDGVPLGRAGRPHNWPDFEALMLSLLDALSHAHSHDVVHRDLKPSNVLIAPEEGELTLVDFGIAAVFEQIEGIAGVDDADEVRGTPQYMPPERILGKIRDQGPPTDLYAVGCLAWKLLCGGSPYQREETGDVLDAHLFDYPRDFEPGISVPPGIHRWFAGLLAKRPWTRFERAADAAWALMQLPNPAEDAAASDDLRESGVDLSCPAMGTLDVADYEAVGDETVPMEEAIDLEVEQDALEELGAPESVRPPIPKTWERSGPLEPDPGSATGLGLFRLRRLPMVDRREERNALWGALREVDRTGQPGSVLLEGVAGSGKTRLADWMLRRAHELGAAFGVRAFHTPTGGPADGLEAALLRHFRLDDLDRAEAVEPLVDRLGRLGVDESTAAFDADAICGGAGRDARTGDRDEGALQPTERRLAFLRVLESLAEVRPVVLVLDDIPWSRKSARFVRFLFRDGVRSLPILVVMTARRSDWDERSRTRELLEPLLERRRSRRLSIEPLERHYQRRVIEQMLRFSRSTVDELVDRSEGRPLFAIQLANDWVERDLLESTEEGFELREEAREEIPVDLRAIWNRRVDELIRRHPGERRELERALELAAALGKQVDTREWRYALEEADLDYEPALVDDLVEAGLAERRANGWQFVHGLLVESLESRARESGRAAEHHRCCARAIAAVYPRRASETAARRAEHWLETDRRERALQPLLLATRRAYDRGNYERHTELLDRRRRLMDEFGFDADDPERVENEIERGRSHIKRGDAADAERCFRSAHEVASSNDWDELTARGVYGLGYAYEQLGHADEAFGALDRAEQLFEHLNDRRGRARCLQQRAHTHRRLTQEFSRARELALEARRIFDDLGETHRTIACETIRCVTHFLEENHSRAEEIARRIREVSGEVRNRYFQGRANNLLGEFARKKGAIDRAGDLYEAARRELEACGSSDVMVPATNGVLVAVAKGEYHEARRRLDKLEDLLDAMDERVFRSYLHLGRCICAAGLEDWSQWGISIERARENLAGHDFLQPDHAELAEDAAELADARGSERRAREMYEFARSLRRELDDHEAVRRLDREIESLAGD